MKLRIRESHCPYLMIIRALANIGTFIFKISWGAAASQHPPYMSMFA